MTILKEEYDYVILDTAPVGLVADTLNIGRYANTTIYICRAGYTPKYSIGQLNDFADQGKLPNACFVINDIKPHRGSRINSNNLYNSDFLLNFAT
jgi:Mrp family chromosome partitioning ATPase